ncbi:MAG: methylated-DNA--[protein]-cysteine S-methyltransferase [Rhizobiales bacterium]|nr:methylated-DNA--[protein]-cysteine S-methyltransferase [Hyphomicrobiales bacterium]
MTDTATIHHTLFPTAIGTCGVAWSEHGLTALALPERDEAATEKRLIAKSHSAGKAAPPRSGADAIALIQQYCAGECVDFSSVPLDLTGIDPDRRRIYETMRALNFGETTTYGALARKTGAADADWEAAQKIGVAMGRNPLPIIVPCHRVLAAGGKPGGFSAYGGTATKETLLALEGIHLDGGAPRLPGL